MKKRNLVSKQFIFYSLIGFSGVFLDLILFSFLHYKLEINFQLANVLSTTAGIINNFLFNAFLNFKAKDHLLKRFMKFYVIGLLGLSFSAALLEVLIRYFEMPALVAKIITIIVIVILQFNLNKKFSFSKSY